MDISKLRWTTHTNEARFAFQFNSVTNINKIT